MKIVVNGKTEEINEMTIQQYLAGRGITEFQMKGIAVGYNDFIIKSHNWNEIVLKENDTIEIVKLMSGG